MFMDCRFVMFIPFFICCTGLLQQEMGATNPYDNSRDKTLLMCLMKIADRLAAQKRKSDQPDYSGRVPVWPSWDNVAWAMTA
jgi:hypothetical protein